MADGHCFDVIVIGGGHAGTEAAAAAARFGANTALITSSGATVGNMSCNPAIGGLGKGHLVREIDALDGIMGRAADRAGIQFRLLNRSRGPAVRGPRTQADRDLYRQAVSEALAVQDSLTIIEDRVDDLLLDGERVSGVTGQKDTYRCGCVVLATGTFLNGMIHRGAQTIPAGRIGEKPSIALARRLYAMGLPMGRLKTGTPPRLARRSIDWNRLDQQHADSEPSFFSLFTQQADNEQITCAITSTTSETHAIVRDNISSSAIYSGAITQKGPRYCPSIEDKMTRFADRDSHQIFLEPEGLDVATVYPNGLSTSLPDAVQTAMVRSVTGLERAEITQYGYAIAYDYVDPRALTPDLQLAACRGLYLAGQINGTTGYEEAAAQGLIAGLNAARTAAAPSTDPFVLSRADAYIGVMIDDLVTRGVSEPYRMFTSRAEYRLSLRADNADMRLTPAGCKAGIVSDDRRRRFTRWRDDAKAARDLLVSLSPTPDQVRRLSLTPARDGRKRSAFDALGAGSIDVSVLFSLWPQTACIGNTVRHYLRAESLYAHYLPRQQSDMRALRAEETLTIPADFDYSRLCGLSYQARDSLIRSRPASLGQAARLEGVTAATVTVLLAHLKKKRRA